VIRNNDNGIEVSERSNVTRVELASEADGKPNLAWTLLALGH